MYCKIVSTLRWAAGILALTLPALANAQQDSGRWVQKELGVLEDSFAGLQWSQRDSLGDTNWEQARAFCANLKMDGGGWRLPTSQELSMLYGREGPTPCGCEGELQCKVSPKFYLTGVWFWTGDQGEDSSKAYGISFCNGRGHFSSVSNSTFNRALCVRRSP